MNGYFARRGPHVRLLFVALVGAMVLVAAGHLYLVRGLTTMVAGLPVWLWVHLAVVAVLLAAAWIATGLVTGGEV